MDGRMCSQRYGEAPLVEVLEDELVPPAYDDCARCSPPHEAWLPLSPCDVLLQSLHYTRRLLFYAAPSPPSAHQHPEAPPITLLRSSLARALAHFYPLAGRLVLHEGHQLAVHCNDAGAQFVRARLRPKGPSMAQLQGSGFQWQAFFTQLTTRRSSVSHHLHQASAPVLSVQVTSFSCGGFALGVAVSHVIADGTSLWHFLTSWAECALGREKPSLLPVHDRWLLSDRTPPPSPSSKPRIAPFFEDLQDNPIQRRERTVGRSFCMPKESVDALKRAAQQRYSGYEVVCAHIWKHTNRAWNHPKDTKVGFISVVNMRERMVPPLPRGYFGNAVLWTIATASSGQLNTEDLAATAGRIHDSVVQCSSSRMQDLLRFLQMSGSPSTEDVIQPLYCNGVRMRTSSSSKFPVGSVDFGWGKPLAALSGSAEEINNVGFYPDPSAPGAVVFCLALPKNIMHALEREPSFCPIS